jgi:hypothetical protein
MFRFTPKSKLTQHLLCFSILPNQITRKQLMLIHKKIDAQGNYLQFPGITVIADMSDKNEAFWLQVHEFLNKTKTLCSYYAPLPYSSYHYPNNWPVLLSDERFQHLHARLQANHFTPTATVVGIKVSYALQLNLTLPQSQHDLINTIADEFDIQNKIPKTFHVTLAYAYKELSDSQIMAPEIEQLASLCLGKELSLQPPRLCFFHDMQQFFSWDGKNNPFK